LHIESACYHLGNGEIDWMGAVEASPAITSP
jgi:hypothetical protein